MKIDSRSIDAFLANPGICRAVLLYGEDAGLVRERGAIITQTVAGTLDDPFRVIELAREDASRIADEIASIPMTGGRRVVRVRDVTDAATNAVQTALAGKGDGIVVLEAGELAGRSKLRALLEAAADGAAVACYGEQGADLGRTIAATLAAEGLSADPEATTYLGEHLGNDRGVTRQELAKLALYTRPETVVTLDAAMATIGDLAGLELEDAIDAAMAGDIGRADRALELAFNEGAAPVSVLRALLYHLHKIERLHLAMQTGQSASEAVRGLRPPVFFRRQPALTRAASLWPAAALAAAAKAVWEAELACKHTGTPAETLARHTVLTIARRAGRRR